MKKHTAILLCLLLALSLGACSGPVVFSADGLALDVDYITIGEHPEESVQEEGSDSLFGLLQARMRADAQGPEAGSGLSTQNDSEATAHQEVNSAAVGGATNASAHGSSGNQGSAAVGGSQSSGPGNPAGPGEEAGSGNGGESEPATPQRNTVTLQIRADNFVASEHFDQSWAGIVPPNGLILPTTTFEFQDGDTVYDVLRQAGRAHGISVSSRGTTFGIYIEGIGGLFEFDGGPLSGWMYSVNGWYPNFGAARYFLQPGDRIEWNYTTDLGNDLGVDMGSW